jgi:hypothetical protein
MKTQNKLKLAGALLGATLITATGAIAGSGGDKSGAGSCGCKPKASKGMEKKDGKCGAGSCGGNKATTEAMDGNATMMKQAGKGSDGKCGAGKCG